MDKEQSAHLLDKAAYICFARLSGQCGRVGAVCFQTVMVEGMYRSYAGKILAICG